jgi:EXPERA (EXPanded EBP superfamily)
MINRRPIPLSKRPGDIAILAFFLINLLFITYVVDFEQLVIPDPAHFTYPPWPPPAAVDLVHHYGQTLDPLLLARPPWWKTTIWIDALLFGPFYLAAIYAYIKGRNWIRIPSIIYSSMLITNVLIILSEEIYGPHASPHLPVVLLLNFPWLAFPLFIIYRMWRSPYPFSAESPAEISAYTGPQPVTPITGEK